MEDKIKLKSPNKLSLRLLEHRRTLNITQTKMAKKIGLSNPVYAGIERGTYGVSLKLLTIISRYLDISLEEAVKLYFNK